MITWQAGREYVGMYVHYIIVGDGLEFHSRAE